MGTLKGIFLLLLFSAFAFAVDAGQERMTAFHETILSSFDYFALPGLRFPVKERKLAVASWWINQPRRSMEVRREARKLYFLIIPFLDHQDAYSKVGSISAVCEDGSVIRKDLCFPGDLDWWGPPAIIGDFATLGKGWSRSISVELPSAIGNVVELDLGKERKVERVIIETNGRYPALGVLSLLCLR
jgi:hypothetical protein